MIKITKGNNVMWVDEALLPQVCLQVCGGGWAPAQTANAIVMQRMLRDEGKARIKNVHLELVKVYAVKQHFDEYGQIIDLAAVTGGNHPPYKDLQDEFTYPNSHGYLDAPEWLPKGSTLRLDKNPNDVLYSGFHYVYTRS